MIKPEVVQQIFERAHIEEVVGDFVNLKKRGSNLLGLCPFHNEKTPSFSVSPGKGIYKCFGCGKGGNSVNFIMEHEHLNYPEALKFLGKKFGIEVEEKELSPEEKQAADARESLMVVSEAASLYFQDRLKNSDEGKSIGLSYFRERGMDASMIERFALGYCPEKKEDSFTDHALGRGFQKEFLLKTGLSKEGRNGLYDFYHGRVIFPIRSISGRPLGFGGRTLRNDKQIAKYFNSPESEIYNKSKVLYGLFESKSAIVKQDKCYMVEGYMDVISLHQAGIENVVASSGTSLTAGQIRLIRRYTPHITILYDSDNAGIKAAFRGIDLLLEEGMKVRVVSLPEGEDPDTMAQKLGQEAMIQYLEDNGKDFFEYMCDTLLTGNSQDPIQRSEAITEIIGTLSLYPDRIERNLKSQELANRLGIDQQTLLYELRKSQKKKQKEKEKQQERQQTFDAPPPPGMEHMPVEEEIPVDRDMPVQSALLNASNHAEQERDIIRLLLNYGADSIHLELEGAEEDEFGNVETEEISVERFVVEELSEDKYVQFKEPFCSKVWAMYQSAFAEQRTMDVQALLRHPDHSISATVADLMSEKHELHRWEDRKIYPLREKDKLLEAVEGAINSLKIHIANSLRKETLAVMQHEKDYDRVIDLQKKKMRLDQIIAKLCEARGTVIPSN